jgi:hypothetical protein
MAHLMKSAFPSNDLEGVHLEENISIVGSVTLQIAN